MDAALSRAVTESPGFSVSHTNLFNVDCESTPFVLLTVESVPGAGGLLGGQRS
jgi:hypothetical protein